MKTFLWAENDKSYLELVPKGVGLNLLAHPLLVEGTHLKLDWSDFFIQQGKVKECTFNSSAISMSFWHPVAGYDKLIFILTLKGTLVTSGVKTLLLPQVIF